MTVQSEGFHGGVGKASDSCRRVRCSFSLPFEHTSALFTVPGLCLYHWVEAGGAGCGVCVCGGSC